MGESPRWADGSVVAVAGAGDEFALAAWGNDLDLDGTEAAVFFGVGGIVGKRVLVADVFGDLFADVVDVFDVFREIGDAAGSVSNFFQSSRGFFCDSSCLRR